MTPEQVKAMSDDELRIKVAELLGWRQIDGVSWIGSIYKDGKECVAHDLPSSSHLDPWLYPSHKRAIPDYPRDLNACHEMEKAINKDGLCARYLDTLEDITGCAGLGHINQIDMIRATARQRCEAFVLTMENHNDT